ncbi:MAG: DUF6020 family protein [Solirubrobacterales bacterium]
MILRKDKWFLIIGSVLLAAGLVFYLIGFYPGFMSVDSISQWKQMVEFKFSSWHPVISTLFYYICARLWNSPASVAMAQILILTIVFMFGIYVLLKLKVNKIILSFSILFFALYPTNGLMVINLWKDIMYSIMLLWLTIILIEIITSKGKWLAPRYHRIILIINLLGVIFLRYNGILTFALVIISLAIVFKKYRKKTIGITIIIMIMYGIISGPFFNLLKVEKEPSVEALGIPMQQVAAVIKYNGMLNQHQKEFFNKLLPLNLWASEYNPYSTNPIKFNDKFDVLYASQHKGEFIKFWSVAVINNPGIVTEAYLKHTSMIWRPVPYKDAYTYTLTAGISKNDMGLKSAVLSQGVTYRANRILSYTLETDKMIYFWRPAVWLYICIIAGLIIAKLRGKEYLLLLVPILSNSLAFMIATPAQDYRYQYVNFLIASIMVPMTIGLLIKRKQVSNN